MRFFSSKIGRRRTLVFVGYFCFWAVAGLAQPGADRAALAGAGAPVQNIQFVAPRPGTTIVAQTRRGPLTVLDLRQFMQVCPIPGFERLPADKIAALPDDRLKEVARWVATRREAAAEVDQSSDSSMVQSVTANVQPQIDRLIVRSIQKTLRADAASTPTQAQIETYYGKNKPLYHQPFSFRMRQLLLTTYTPYVVKEGDTLESIATQVSGDKSQADNIRADNESHPLRREKGKEFKSLVPNEKLLVPMNKEQQEEVRGRLESYLKELKNGTTFEELAKKYSEAGTKGELSERLPKGTTVPQILPQILEAAKATPAGGISPIFQTKHGFQVIQVAEKNEERDPPLSELRDRVVARMQQDELRKKLDVFMDKLFQDPALKIKYDLIAGGDKLTTDTVIATVGPDQVRWDQIKEIWQSKGRPAEPEFINQMLRRMSVLMVPLLRQYVKPQLSDPKNPLAHEVKNVRVGVTGAALIDKTVADRIKGELTPAALQTWYAAHQEEYKTPPTVKYTFMMMALGPDQSKLGAAAKKDALDRLQANMSDQLKKVKSADQFVSEAAQINEALRTQGIDLPDDSAPVEVAKLPDSFKSQLERLKPGHWSEPFVNEDRVASVLLRERRPMRIPPLKEVTPRVEHDLFMSRTTDTKAQVEQEYTKKANFTWKPGP